MWINKKTDKVYIGSSVSLGSRLRSHFIGSGSNKSLQKDILKYGITSFMATILEFIEYNEDIKELRKYIIEREQFYLDTICKASDPTNEFYKLSYNKNRKADSPLGVPKSEETKQKLSIAHTGKVLTEEHKRNISLYHTSKQPGYIHPAKMYGTSDKQKDVVKQMCINNKVPILQYSSDGIFIKEWECIRDASINLNIDDGGISKNIDGKSNICKSFIFKRKLLDDIPSSIEIINLKTILVFDKELNFLGEYNSAIDIQRSLRVNRSEVTRAIKNKNGISKNYIFKYKHSTIYENM